MAIQTLTIHDFTGGINDNRDPSKIRDNELSQALNVHINKTGDLEARLGQDRVTTTTAAVGISTATITSIFQAEQATGNEKKLITADVTAVFYIENAGAYTKVSHNVTAGSTAMLWRWVIFNDYFIGVADSTGSSYWPVVKWSATSSSVVTHLGDTVTASITAPVDIAVWNSRVCVAQGVDVYISDASEHEDWRSGDSQILRFRGARYGEEAITAIYPYRGNLIVFKPSSIWEVSPGNGLAETWEINQIGFGIGTECRHTIQDVGFDLLFYNRQGINSLQDVRDRGGKAVSGRVSEKVYRTIFSLVNVNAIKRAVALYDKNNEEYILAIPTGTNTENDTVVILNVYHTRQNGDPSLWKYEYAYNISCIAEIPGTGLSRIEVGSYDGHIYVINSDNDDQGTAFDKKVRTKQFDLGDVSKIKTVHKLLVDMDQGEDFDTEVILYCNDFVRNKTYQANVWGDAIVWDGGATWDTPGLTWSGVSSGIHKRGIGYTVRDFQIQLRENTGTEFWRINKILLDIEAFGEDLLV